MINESIKDIVNREGYGISSLRITEASLARVLRWMAGTPTPKAEKGVDVDAGMLAEPHERFKVGGHFAILTSWRKFDSKVPTIAARDVALKGDKSELKANEQNFIKLTGDIRKNRLGAIRLTGSWLEEGGKADKPYERSLFIPGKSQDGLTGRSSPLTRDLTIEWGKNYNQDAIIYAGPETGGKAELWGLDVGLELKTGKRVFEKKMTWVNVGLRSAAAIEKNLNRAKQWMNTPRDEDTPEYFNTGATQVGTSTTKQGAPKLSDKPGFRFERVYESVGQEYCSLGVRWFYDDDGLQDISVKHRIFSLLNNDPLAEEIHKEWMSGRKECFEF